MNSLDKLVNYSPTFYAHVNSPAFSKVRAKSLNPVSNLGELELCYQYRDWLGSFTQWLYPFQYLHSFKRTVINKIYPAFEMPSRTIEVIPP